MAERQLQLIISTKIAREYTSTLAEVGIDEPLIDRFSTTLEKSGVVTKVNLGKRLTDSRDPKDNVFLSTAAAGRAKYLLSNDKDLLDIPNVFKRKYKFHILTPADFLHVYFEQKQ